jgi:hypothetical protein
MCTYLGCVAREASVIRDGTEKNDDELTSSSLEGSSNLC